MEATSNALVPFSGRELAKRKLGDIVKVEDSSDSDSDSDGGDSYVASAASSSSGYAAPSKKVKTEPRTNSKSKSNANANAKPRKPRTNLNPGPKTPPKKWTAAELEALFAAALGDGPTMRMFENKVPGRTSKQCADAWS